MPGGHARPCQGAARFSVRAALLLPFLPASCRRIEVYHEQGSAYPVLFPLRPLPFRRGRLCRGHVRHGGENAGRLCRHAELPRRFFAAASAKGKRRGGKARRRSSFPEAASRALGNGRAPCRTSDGDGQGNLELPARRGTGLPLFPRACRGFPFPHSGHHRPERPFPRFRRGIRPVPGRRRSHSSDALSQGPHHGADRSAAVARPEDVPHPPRHGHGLLRKHQHHRAEEPEARCLRVRQGLPLHASQGHGSGRPCGSGPSRGKAPSERACGI